MDAPEQHNDESHLFRSNNHLLDINMTNWPFYSKSSKNIYTYIIYQGCSGTSRARWHALSGHGTAPYITWHALAWHGKAWCGMAGHGTDRHGMAQGTAVARHGEPWHGTARNRQWQERGDSSIHTPLPLSLSHSLFSEHTYNRKPHMPTQRKRPRCPYGPGASGLLDKCSLY